jgi:glycosyltransferase involved in cell wall biosynthesis
MAQPEPFKVLVNGISAKGGGGLSILSNFLRVAGQAEDSFSYVVAVTDATRFADLACPRVSFVSVGGWSRSTMILLSSIVMLPCLMRRKGCDLLFNLADIPVLTRRPQVFLFDWPYAAFPESPALRLGSIRERLARWVKLSSLRTLLPFADLVIAQNAPLAQRLRTIYRPRVVDVVPNAVSLENIDGGEVRDFGISGGFKLLCLSRYYSHKNIEIFLPVARRIRDAGLDAKIITTLDRDENEGARCFLDAVDAEGLSAVIVNVGSVPMAQVPSLYKQTDALLLPTLLESFSGTYVEAMHHRRPILTSDLDFAKGVCGDSAFYFDPTDDAAIFDAIRTVMARPELREKMLARSAELLAEMPSWNEAYRLFTCAFYKANKAKT